MRSEYNIDNCKAFEASGPNSPVGRAVTGLGFRVPDDLSELDQWVLWRDEKRASRRAKVPHQVNGELASSTDRQTWNTLEAVLAAWRADPQRYAGVGWVFEKSAQFVGIDLDDCLDGETNIKPWAAGIVERFSDSYTEVSPSGCGLKIWARGSLPANLPGVKVENGQVEMYDHARYFTVTGRTFCGAPLEVEHHEQDLLLLYEHLRLAKRHSWPLQPLEGGRIPYGQQHSMLVSIAGTLRARRLCEEAIEACLQIVNAKQCERPGTPENIRRIVRSSRHWRVS